MRHAAKQVEKRCELAKVMNDGSYEHIGDYATETEAVQEIRRLGPGEYAIGDTEAASYETTVIHHADGTLTAQSGSNDAWYTIQD